MQTIETPSRSSSVLSLLVSVRNVAEARVARRYPVQIIDFKEPRAGALGRCEPAAMRDLIDVQPPPLGWSSACGELIEWGGDATIPDHVSFAKAGPAGIKAGDLSTRLSEFRAACGPLTQAVAVAYGDHERADALSPERILSAAIDVGYRWFLIDTMSKDGRCLFDWMQRRRIAELLAEAKARQVRVVLAGSLTSQHLEIVRGLGPDLIGVRGAICSGGRNAEIDERKLEELCQRLETQQFQTTEVQNP